MAYNTTTWGEDDELTSERLQQMSDNDEWLKNQQPKVEFGGGAGTSAQVGSEPTADIPIIIKCGFNAGYTDSQGDLLITIDPAFPNALLSVHVNLVELDQAQYAALTPHANYQQSGIAIRASALGFFKARIYHPDTGNAHVSEGNFGVSWTAFGW